jgi:hypothetical protein
LNKVNAATQAKLVELINTFPSDFLPLMFFHAVKAITFSTANPVGMVLLIQLLVRLEVESRGW